MSNKKFIDSNELLNRAFECVDEETMCVLEFLVSGSKVLNINIEKYENIVHNNHDNINNIKNKDLIMMNPETAERILSYYLNSKIYLTIDCPKDKCFIIKEKDLRLKF